MAYTTTVKRFLAREERTRPTPKIEATMIEARDL